VQFEDESKKVLNVIKTKKQIEPFCNYPSNSKLYMFSSLSLIFWC